MIMAESRPLKVLHIASGDLWAGAEVQLFTLASTLKKQQHIEVAVVLLNHGTLEQKLRENGVRVIVLDEAQLTAWQILPALIRSVGEIQPDVIHTHRIKENILGSIAALFAGRIPTLRTAHGAPEHRPAWYRVAKRLILFLDWMCGRFLQKRVIAVSEDLAGILRQSFPAEKIAVIENGIDIAALTASARLHETADPGANKPVAKSKFKVGIAGRLVSIKRVDLFIQTARQLADNHPEASFSFHIYGDGPLRDELERLSRHWQLQALIHFEGHCDNIPQQLGSLDVLLMTSDHEGLPMILLEAMALQAPIVAHAVGGIPNLLAQGECGVLVAEHSAAAYASAVYRLYQDPVTRSEIAGKAFKRVTQLYSAEQNAENYEAEYKKLRQ